MAKDVERLTATDEKVDKAIARVTEDVAALRVQIEELSKGELSPEAEAKVVEIEAKIDALDPTKPDVLPE